MLQKRNKLIGRVECRLKNLGKHDMNIFQSSQLYIQCPMEFQFILLISEIDLQIKIITRDQTQEKDGLGYQNLSVLRDGLTQGKLHFPIYI